MTTTTIDPKVQVMTLINYFTVEPERQRELVDILVNATEEVMRHQSGFVSANIHASQDGCHVVNYAQWQSERHFREMLREPACQEHMAAASAVATAEPSLYTVESVHHR